MTFLAEVSIVERVPREYRTLWFPCWMTVLKDNTSKNSYYKLGRIYFYIKPLCFSMKSLHVKIELVCTIHMEVSKVSLSKGPLWLYITFVFSVRNLRFPSFMYNNRSSLYRGKIVRFIALIFFTCYTDHWIKDIFENTK